MREKMFDKSTHALNANRLRCVRVVCVSKQVVGTKKGVRAFVNKRRSSRDKICPANQWLGMGVVWNNVDEMRGGYEQ